MYRSVQEYEFAEQMIMLIFPDKRFFSNVNGTYVFLNLHVVESRVVRGIIICMVCITYKFTFLFVRSRTRDFPMLSFQILCIDSSAYLVI